MEKQILNEAENHALQQGDVSGSALLKNRTCNNCEHWDKQSTHALQRKCTNEAYKSYYNMESCIIGCFASCGWFERSEVVKEKLKNMQI